MAILLAVLGAAMVYWLQMKLYFKYWKKGLSASVVFAQEALFEKERGQIREVITNGKLLPLLMLRVKFQVDRSFRFEQEGNVTVSDRCYKNDIFSVMFYQRVTRTLTFQAERRGYYTIDRMDIVSSDLFMRSSVVGTVPCHTTLLVYPRYADIDRMQIPFRSMMGTILTRQYAYEDPFEFRGIRSYQPFDRMKDINWKASAKTGELKVNVHEDTARQEVCILLNLEQEALLVHEELKEESIRIAATLAELFLAKGIVVSMHGNGHDILTKETIKIPAGAGSVHLTVIRERLARIDLAQECSEYGTMLAGYQEKEGKHMLYVLVSSSQRMEIQKSFERMCRRSDGSVWILPLYPDMKVELEECPSAKAVRWEMER